MPDSTPWYRTRRGPAVVVGYAVVTLAVLVYTTGPIAVGEELVVEIPAGVYLFGFLGGMTYAFTSIVAKFERGVRGVVKVGLRALAALPLAAGVYLLAVPLGLPAGDGTGTPQLVAGVSFLVGLYVNVTLKALGGLADRLFTGPGTGAGDDPSRSPTGSSEVDADEPASGSESGDGPEDAAPVSPAP